MFREPPAGLYGNMLKIKLKWKLKKKNMKKSSFWALHVALQLLPWTLARLTEMQVCYKGACMYQKLIEKAVTGWSELKMVDAKENIS